MRRAVVVLTVGAVMGVAACTAPAKVPEGTGTTVPAGSVPLATTPGPPPGEPAPTTLPPGS